LANELELLRMLEPAVRPDGVSRPTPRRDVPIESRSFDSLLQEARQINATQAQDSQTPAPPADTPPLLKAGLIGQLAQIDQVHNSSLRALIAPNTQAK